jgi:hypothetical protein
VCLGVVTVTGSTDANAATWDGRQLAGESYRLPLFGISCPSTSLCVAVGGNNTIASATSPTGDASDWKVVHVGAGEISIGPNQRQIRAISCPSTQLCVAVSFEGLIYSSTNPTDGAGAWNVTDIDGSGPNTHFYGVSCPTVTFCVASAGDAKVVSSTNPTGPASAWTETQLPGPLELRGISCASTTLCIAVGDNGDNIRPELGDQAVAAASTNPLGGTWEVAPLPGRQSLFGISCPSAGLCVSGDTLGNLLVATQPTAGTGAWRQIAGGGTVQITDVDCLSPGLCLAVDNNGDVLTSTNPNGDPRDWTFTNVLPYPSGEEGSPNHFFGISCPSRELCAIAVNGAQIFTSTDPFATRDPATVVPKRGAKKKNRPKRPRVEFARRPSPGIELATGRKVTVPIRFFAFNRAQVRGFLCKMDGRSLKRCRSPKFYRVGLGKHVFRVRAVGWTGLWGPVEVARFEVCRPVKYGSCMRRLPPGAG